MKHNLTGLIALLLVGTTTLHGQGFVNFDFESADTTGGTPSFEFLPWQQALPGWSHNPELDPQTVYHGTIHVGVDPWYLLLDRNLPNGAAGFSSLQVQGQYALNIKSGQYPPAEDGPWIFAYVAQTGLVPLGTRSLILLAAGNLGLQWNGQAVPLVSLGGDRYGADFTSMAGSSGELRLINLNLSHDSVSIDHLQFSPTVVPEPATFLLLGLAGIAWIGARRFGTRY